MSYVRHFMSSILAVIDANLCHSAARNFATALQLMNSEKLLALLNAVFWFDNDEISRCKVLGSTTECVFGFMI